MITKYFSKVTVRFNPLLSGAKPARLFLASIPPSLRISCPVEHEVLGSASKNAPIIKVTYKDKKEVEVDPTGLTFTEVQGFFDRHSRVLKLKDSIDS